MAKIDYRSLTFEEQAKRLSIVERIALAPPDERRRLLKSLGWRRLEELVARWLLWARPGQLPPAGDWRVWLLMAGRGYGKTRAGAEWLHHLAEEPHLRIAIVGPTADEVRAVMVEGASGLLGCAPADNRPMWEPSVGQLTWPSGSRGFVYSAANPESLRGPEHDHAWCDEIAKWPQAEAAWDNLTFGLRRGRYPRALATTTPRPTALMRRLLARTDVALTRGRTDGNVMLAESSVDYLIGLYGGTLIGRQELDGELIEEVEGALWTREMVERCRVLLPLPGGREGAVAAAGDSSEAYPPPAPPWVQGGEFLRRVVVGVDPPASASGDACGIVVCGLGADGTGYVLDDRSVRGLAPEGWAAAVVRAAEAWEADRVVVETNQGGDMVESVLRSADCTLPVAPVRARFGKGRRAEPVAMKFAKGQAKFAGAFPGLEDELCGLTVGGGYEGPGRSPDRADAMVWAMTELLCARERAEPRIRTL